MTGPEHYKEAERLLAQANQQQSDDGPGCGSEEVIAEAQVHATLAIAAAQALSISTSGLYPEKDCAEWAAAVTS